MARTIQEFAESGIISEVRIYHPPITISRTVAGVDSVRAEILLQERPKRRLPRRDRMEKV